MASGVRDLQPGVTARCSSARVGVGKRRGGAWRSRRRRGREARLGLQPGKVRSSLRRGSGRGRGGARYAARQGVRRVSAWAKALAREVFSPASWRCVPRRVWAWAKTRRPSSLSTPGGRGATEANQWHLGRTLGKRFRGCRAKRPYVEIEFKARPAPSHMRCSLFFII